VEVLNAVGEVMATLKNYRGRLFNDNGPLW